MATRALDARGGVGTSRRAELLVHYQGQKQCFEQGHSVEQVDVVEIWSQCVQYEKPSGRLAWTLLCRSTPPSMSRGSDGSTMQQQLENMGDAHGVLLCEQLARYNRALETKQLPLVARALFFLLCLCHDALIACSSLFDESYLHQSPFTIP